MQEFQGGWAPQNEQKFEQGELRPLSPPRNHPWFKDFFITNAVIVVEWMFQNHIIFSGIFRIS